MRAEDIVPHVRRQPFVPFRIHVSDGSAYDIHHSELIAVTRTIVFIGIQKEDNSVPEESTWCDPANVTRIEFINGRNENTAK